MISRRTTLLLAELFEHAFRAGHGFTSRGYTYYPVAEGQVYDFLQQEDHPAWFCNCARDAASPSITNYRAFKDFVLNVHTGESLKLATPNWTWPEREKLGQELLRDLAEDLGKQWKARTYVPPDVAGVLAKFPSSLELDGYAFRGDALLAPEEDVLDAKDQRGVLLDLFREVQFKNQDTVFHHLALSEEHYIAKRWEGCISNSRKFLEEVLQEAAASHYLLSHGSAIPEEIYSRPAYVRDYLESCGLIEAKEKQALSSSYGLLSKTGGHPYIAENDQARLLRHLALTFSQFALLRLKGSRVRP